MSKTTKIINLDNTDIYYVFTDKKGTKRIYRLRLVRKAIEYRLGTRKFILPILEEVKSIEE